MKGVLKKTLSMLLVLCVMSTFMPFYVLAAEGDVCEIVETTVGYPTLDAALTTVQNGQTIRLLKDINYSSGISIVDKSITFNLNGFNLDVVSTAIGDTYAENCGLYVEGNSAVSLDGLGEFNVTGSWYGVFVECDKGENAQVTVNNATGNNGRDAVAAQRSKVTVKGNATSNGEGCRGVWASYENAEVIVEGNVYANGNNSQGVYAEELGKVTVKGSVTVTGYNSRGIYAYHDGKAAVGNDIVINVEKDITASGTGSIGVQTIDSNITVGGNVAGEYGGIDASGSDVDVTGDVQSTGSEVNTYGATATRLSEINIGGDVRSNEIGAYIWSEDGETPSMITINGVIDAPKYVKIGSKTLAFINGSHKHSLIKDYLIYEDPDFREVGTIIVAEFAGGDGSQLNPYLIAHADHLYNVRNHLDKHFRQIADVDLNGFKTGEGWNPIGTPSNSFIGIYDGDGFTVRNLFINKVGEWNVRVPSGLFRNTGAVAEIRNLNLESVDITGCYYVGSIVGSNSGKITGVISSGTVTGEFDTGGLVGVSGKTGSITDSSFTGTVTGTDVIEYGEWTGGLVGYNNGSITNCQADVTVVSVYRTIGGLVGENLEDGIITGSSSTGSVTAGNYTGGLIGCNSGEITRCHSSSTVNGDSNVGGLVGNNGGPITESYSTGNVTGSSSDVGGLVGYNGETITSSYSTGTVTGYSNVGGLVGRNDDPITGSYSVGSVTGNNSKGGLVGYDLYRKATDCYWDKETSGIGYSCGGTGKTTAEMKQQPTFINWDFTATWNINDSMNNGYPFLRWHSSVATPTTPSAPQNFSATPGDTQVALSWEAPASDGGSAITNYQVSNDNGTNWTDVALSTTHTFTGLTNGTPYTFKVRAVNSVGNSTEASATTTPQAEVCEINGIKYATLEQALAVVTDGQTIKLLTHITHTSPIVVDTETIYFDLGNYNLLVDTSTDPDNTIRHVVSAINGGKLRLNGTGTGTFNVKSTSYSIGVRVIGAYSEVTVDNVDVTRAGATGVYMYGSGPNLDGGKVTVNGHINAGNTAISVNAKNGIITVNGDITAAHTGVTTSTNAGTSVTVNGNINVLGSEPQHVGGYGIMASGLTSVKVTGNVTSQGTDYVGVYAYGGGIEVGGNVVSSGTGAKAYPNSSYGKGNVTIDGSLSAGTPFVVVGNIVKTPDQITEPTTKPGLLTYTDGASNVWIGSVGSIATTAPTIPQSFNATAGDGQIALNWAAPSSNGGSAITKYQVSKDNGTSWTDVGLNTTYTFTGLTNGTEYTFKVRAVNSVGNGAEASVSATPTATSIFYAVSVNNGTGGGNYEQGVPVTITANTAPSGQQFKEWITTPLVTFIDSTSATDATAKFTMPEQAVTATAVYESIPTTVMSVTVNPSSVTAQKGETHQFSAIVNGVNNPSQNVTWTVHGASSETIITTSGALTIAVSETAATLTVTATSSADPSKSGTSTVTVTQPVQPTIYTVTFNENGGYVSPVTMQTGADGKLTGLPTPSRDGYTFDGWYTATDGGTTISTNTIFTANTIIYAHWAQDSGGSIVLIIPTTPVNRAKAKRGDGSEAMLPVIVDEDAGSASVHLGSRGLDQQGTVITIPSIPSVNTYSVGIPVPDLSTTSFQGTLTVNTDKGNVTAPSNMLNGTGIKGSHAVISIGRGNKDNLPDSVKSAIGNRPLIQLTLSIDGKQTNWSNPNAPVTVSIPYAPTATELQNPESIVVWYIDGSGIVVTVPNGHYDPTTGMVTFDITHFSNYAVVYNRMSFKDVAFDAWYSKAVSFIAARRITLGTGNEDFSPNVKLTRGEFIVLLMRAYDIAPDTIPIDNFYDAANTYYTGYLAAAKRFGITVGVGGNMYAPNKEITRQEMFTMLYNVLNVVGQRPQGDSGKTLSDFIDAEQIAIWAKEAMSLLVKTGIIEGKAGKLDPTGTATRAEMAQVLYKLLKK